MRKLILASAIAIGLLSGSVTAGGAKPSHNQMNFFEIDGRESLNNVSDPRYRIDLLVKDHGPAYEAAIEQVKRLAPKHPELVFVIRNSFDGAPKLTVLTSTTSGGRSIVAVRQWPKLSDAEADAYFSEREKFAQKEYLIELRIAGLKAKIDAALAPHAAVIGRLATSLEAITARFAAAKDNLWPESKRQRLEQLRTDAIQQKPGADKEWAELQDELTTARNVIDDLQISFTRPLEERIESIRQESAGALIRQEKEEEQKLESVVLQDRQSADKT
jgi:hypothetical protein